MVRGLGEEQELRDEDIRVNARRPVCRLDDAEQRRCAVLVGTTPARPEAERRRHSLV